jgi:hypothetical protein
MVGHSDLVGFHDTAVILWRTCNLTVEEGWKFYLPGFAVLAMPLLVWPVWITAPLLALLNIALLWWTVRECTRLAGETARPPESFHMRWTVPIAAVLVYASGTITLGQFNTIVLALCVAAYGQFRRGADSRAGVLTGLAAVIKLFPLVLIAFWLLRGRWKAALAAMATFAVLAVAPSLAMFGWAGTVRTHETWLSQVRGEAYANRGTKAFPPEVPHIMYLQRTHQWMRANNQSLAIVVRRLTTDVADNNHLKRAVNLVNLPLHAAFGAYVTGAAIIFLLLCWTTWQCRHSPAVFDLFAGWLAAVVAFVPIYWTHYFVLALPAVAILCRDTARKGKRSIAFLLLIAWFAGEVLIGSNGCRLVGLQCWLTLGLMAYVVLGSFPQGEPVAPLPSSDQMALEAPR